MEEIIQGSAGSDAIIKEIDPAAMGGRPPQSAGLCVLSFGEGSERGCIGEVNLIFDQFGQNLLDGLYFSK